MDKTLRGLQKWSSLFLIKCKQMGNYIWHYEIAQINFQDLNHIDATIYVSASIKYNVILRKRINKILEVKDKFLLKQLFLYKNNLDEKVNFVYSLSNYYSTEKVENSNIVRVTKYSHKKVGYYNINFKLVLITDMISSPKRIDLENLNIEFKFEESFWEGETSSRVSTKIWEKDFPIEKIEEYPLYKECFTHVNGLELSCKYDFVHTGTIYDHELGVPQWNGMEDAGIYGWDLD